MTGLAKARRLRSAAAELLPLRSAVLALFLALGFLGGYAFSAHCAPETGTEIHGYLSAYRSGAAVRALSLGTGLQTLVCFFRAPITAFLLGFATIGVLALPALCAAQGFLLSFSLFSFAETVGREGFVLLLLLYGVRTLFVLPCTMALAAAAFEKSRLLAVLSLGGEGRRVRGVAYGADYWYRLLVCCVCLLIGSVLELWLTPLLLLRWT